MAAKTKANLKVTFSQTDVKNGSKIVSEKLGFRKLSRIDHGHRLSICSASDVRKKKLSVVRYGSNSRPSSPTSSTQKVERQLSTVGRNHFLQSFGKDTLYGYEGVEHGVLPDKSEEITEKQRQSLIEFLSKKDDQRNQQSAKNEAYERLERAATAGVSRKPSGTKWIYEDILDIRGKKFSGDGAVDIMERIRSQSAKRRIRRIMQADKEKEKERELAKLNGDRKEVKKKTLKGAALALLTIKATTGTWDLFLEKKKWLAERRKRLGLIATRRFKWAARVVRILCKVLKVLSSLSTVRTPETAAQRSWYALKHSSEAKEILFNMTTFEKGKSQYSYIPEWAKTILSKSPMERTDMDLSQLHSLLKGLQSYDKFTYRIQMAMCRAMIYQKVENGRVIIRKGHEGIAFYFIFSGTVFVNVEELLKKSGHVVWHTSVVLGCGDSFGELALLRHIKRTASVVVREDVELLVVDRDVFAVTCPKIYDKELGDKIRFCKSLDIFHAWADDMLRNICFEAQIQEWKSNKIIVKDSSKEREWIYICMQGKCSVVKALDLRLPPVTVEPRKVVFDEPYLFGKQRVMRKQNSSSDVWKKDLEKGFKQAFSFAHQEKKVDESNELENESYDSDSDTDSKRDKSSTQGESAKERIIEVMALSYSNMPHAKGNSPYCEVEDENINKSIQTVQLNDPKLAPSTDEDQSQLVLEKKMQLDSFTLHDLMRSKYESGRLNKEVVYLTIASMQNGDIFDLSEILMPTGRQLMLVSKGALILRIKRVDYLRYSSKTTLKQARDIASNTDYPTDEIIYRSYNDYCAWESYKTRQVNSTIKEVQEICTRHKGALKLDAKFIRSPPKSVEGILRKEVEEQRRLEELDNYLTFVYDANKDIMRHKDMAPYVSRVSKEN